MYLAYKDTNIFFKILPCLLIVMFLAMVLSSSVFASDEIEFYDDVSKEYITMVYPTCFDGYKYYLVFTKKLETGQIYYSFFFADSPFCYNYNSNKIYCVNGGTYYYKFLYTSDSDGHKPITLFDFSGYSIDYFKVYSNPYNSFGSLVGASIQSCNYPVVYMDDNYNVTDEVVFQGAPQETMNPVELTTIAKSIDFSAVVMEVLGILPILLVIVIGLLALRKAIQLLFQMLQKA